MTYEKYLLQDCNNLLAAISFECEVTKYMRNRASSTYYHLLIDGHNVLSQITQALVKI